MSYLEPLAVPVNAWIENGCLVIKAKHQVSTISLSNSEHKRTFDVLDESNNTSDIERFLLLFKNSIKKRAIGTLAIQLDMVESLYTPQSYNVMIDDIPNDCVIANVYTPNGEKNMMFYLDVSI